MAAFLKRKQQFIVFRWIRVESFVNKVYQNKIMKGAMTSIVSLTAQNNYNVCV